MCNCVETVKEHFLKKMKEQKGFTEIIEEPDFVYKSWYPEVLPYFPIVGKYKVKNAFKKFKGNLYPTFCPFCGEKLKNND